MREERKHSLIVFFLKQLPLRVWLRGLHLRLPLIHTSPPPEIISKNKNKNEACRQAIFRPLQQGDRLLLPLLLRDSKTHSHT